MRDRGMNRSGEEEEERGVVKMRIRIIKGW